MKKSIIIFFTTITFLCASDSRIESVTIFSDSLGINKSFNIYLPHDYNTSQKHYPVLYLFRGHEDEWIDPNEDGSRGGRMIKTLMDQLYTSGDVGEMIVVMPGVTSTDQSVHSACVNMSGINLVPGVSGLGSGKFEDYVVYEIIPYVDANFRTLPTRTQRGIDGFSMGGYASMMLATRHPELFISAGGYDGTLMYLDFDSPWSPDPFDDWWMTNSFFDPAFGVPRDTTSMLTYNPANRVYYANSQTVHLLKGIQFLLHSAQMGTGNYYPTKHLLNLLGQHGINNSFDEIPLSAHAIHNWWYADEHMLESLPLHYQRFQNPDTSFNTTNIQMISPAPGDEISGHFEIKWSVQDIDSSSQIEISVSQNAGYSWTNIVYLPGTDSTYLWDTNKIEDGTRTKIRVWLSGDTTNAVTQTDGLFTINNPGNAKPDLVWQTPLAGANLSGDQLLEWYAEDADGDSLSVSLLYSSNNGITWSSVSQNLGHASSFNWQTHLFPNSPEYLLKLICSDDSVSVSSQSARFEVYNQRITVSDSLVQHISGTGNGSVQINIIDPDSLTADTYQITFDDSSFIKTVYDVQNLSTGLTVVDNATELDGFTEGPLFDGLRLLIKDFEQTEVNQVKTGWITGNSTLEIIIYLPEIDMGTHILYGYPYPADYQITIYDHIVDTSLSAYGAPAIPMKFIIQNLSENKKAEIIYLDNDGDNQFSRYDELFIIEKDSVGDPLLTWALGIGGESTAISVSAGDEFLFATNKPFTSNDVFIFNTVTDIENPIIKTPLSYKLMQNYPNPFNPVTTIPFQIAKSEFVKLQIYNMLGQKVVTLISAEKAAGTYQVHWDARVCASGVYFYRLEAGSYSKVRKMVLLR